MVRPYPLLTEPIYKQKIWGGRAFERLRRELPWPPPVGVGESWEVADLAETAVSGGGGGAARSVVANGPAAGRTLGALIAEDPDAIYGGSVARPTFPLLVKLLDARENVSVQVHPSPAYAARHPEAHLKSEAWYVVEAEPDAVIYAGVRADATREDMARAIEAGTVTDLLLTVPAERGACYYLPTGTVHALGAGVLIAEVQNPSDTTFRLYDWGREGRELHVAAALENMSLGPLDVGTAPVAREGVRPLVDCEHFLMEEWLFEAGVARGLTVRTPEVWMAVRGALSIRAPGGDFEPVGVPEGRTVVLPGALGQAEIVAREGGTALRVRVPEASTGA